MKHEEAVSIVRICVDDAKENPTAYRWINGKEVLCAVTPIEAQTALLAGYEAAVRVGTWQPVGFDARGRGGVWVCSSCKRCHPLKSDFCPMCGADMRGPEPGSQGGKNE